MVSRIDLLGVAVALILFGTLTPAYADTYVQCDDGRTSYSSSSCSPTTSLPQVTAFCSSFCDDGSMPTPQPVVCNCHPPGITPTVSEWGLIILSLLLATAGTLAFGRRRIGIPSSDGLGVVQSDPLPLFVLDRYLRVLAVTLVLLAAGLLVFLWIDGEVAAVDLTGAAISAPLFAYLVYLWLPTRE